jgi:hypothetical protein
MMRRLTQPFRSTRTALALTGVAAVAVTACAVGGSSATATPNPAAVVPPSAAATSHGLSLTSFKHVWLIVLENEAESSTFLNPKAEPYLAGTLEKQGLLLKNYYAIGHNSLDNYVALTSGQAPNTDTQEDCQVYTQFPGDTYSATPGEPDQQMGDGCVYPQAVGDIGNQLTAKHLDWRGYMEDMGNDPKRESATCGHPQLNQRDDTQAAEAGDGYAARHDPFVYYDQVIGNNTYCKAHVVPQGSPGGATPAGGLPSAANHGLAWSLQKAGRTPSYSFITPNLCDDGHDYPCKTGQPSLGSAGKDIDRWLKLWVPQIIKSPAYQQGGLLEITFDEGEGAAAGQSCCNEQPDPNGIDGQAGGSGGPGGGQVGALFLSPKLQGGKVSTTAFNHYSTLATDEAIFGLPKLGYAQQAQTFAKVLAADAKH